MSLTIAGSQNIAPINRPHTAAVSNAKAQDAVPQARTSSDHFSPTLVGIKRGAIRTAGSAATVQVLLQMAAEGGTGAKGIGKERLIALGATALAGTTGTAVGLLGHKMSANRKTVTIVGAVAASAASTGMVALLAKGASRGYLTGAAVLVGAVVGGYTAHGTMTSMAKAR
jgi:hypothetical protein